MDNPFDVGAGSGQGNPFDAGASISGTSRRGPNLSSTDGLYALALSQGGAVSQAATELVHPTTGILSTIGNGFKNAFREFVDIISVPSQVVAGIISPSKTVKDAIEKNISVSDVIFGEKSSNASIYQKTGSFLARTAVDILTDPLTYLTFGTGSGIAGLRAGTRISLGQNAAETVGKKALSVGVLSKEGQQVYSYLKKVDRMLTGDLAADIVKTGNATLDLAADELKALMQVTLDSPLRPEFAKKALTNLLEAKPQLASTLLDKGGIKFFGKSVLSGQRIASTMKLIPGMSYLDRVTEQPRLAIASLFDPTVVKTGKDWVRLPMEYVEMNQKWADLLSARGESNMRQLDDIVREFSLNETEGKFLMAAVENKMIPTDQRLAGAYKAILGFSEQDWDGLVKNGFIANESRIEGFAPHVLVETKVGPLGFKMPPSTKTGATELRKIARYVNETTGAEVVGHADALGLKASGVKDIFTDEVGSTYKRLIEPMHDIKSREVFDELEGTILKDPKKAAAMLASIRQEGFEIFDDNLVTAWAARSLKNNKAITMQYFLRDLAASFGYDAVAADARFRRIASAGVDKAAQEVISIMGKEGELVFHPAIAAHVEKYMASVINDDATMGFLKAYDTLQNAWKATVTSIWPAFHGRNAISNALNNFLDLGTQTLNPKIFTTSIGMIKTDRQMSKLARQMLGTGPKALEAAKQFDELAKKIAFTDATGYTWTYGELRQVAKNNNIAFTSRIVTSADVQNGPEHLAKALFKPETVAGKAGAVVKAPFKFGQDVVGRTVEEHARLTNFVANLRNTGDVTLAARRTKQFLFDYNNLTSFERQFLRRLVPFYTFTRKNLELQVRALMETPGRIAAEIHGIETLGEVISGGDQLTEEERESLPDWIKSGVSILTKKNGNQISLISNLGTPLEQPFMQFQGNVLLGSVSPLIRLPVEQMAGYSFFQGKPLSEVTNATAFKKAPQVIKDVIGYTELKGTRSDGSPFEWSVALHPERMNFILNLPPTSRVFSALKQMEAADVSEQAKILQQVTGLRPYSFDLDRERKKREKEMVDKLQDLLTKAGITANFETTYIPKAKKTEILNSYYNSQ